MFTNGPKVTDRIAVAAIEDVARHTVQICYGEAGEPRALGTGVLLRIGSQMFLVSAAHVFTRSRGGGALYAIGGLGATEGRLDLRKRIVTPLDDPYDICVVELDGAESSGLAKLSPAHLGDLGIAHRQSPADRYLMFGFPVSGFLPDIDARRVYTDAWQFISGPCTAQSTLQRIDPSIHVSIQWYPNANVRDPYPEEFHTPTGMSGSGIWCIPAQHRSSGHTVRPYLVGVMTEAWTEDKVFVGTRIDHVIWLIHRQYPRLRQAMDLLLPRRS